MRILLFTVLLCVSGLLSSTCYAKIIKLKNTNIKLTTPKNWKRIDAYGFDALLLSKIHMGERASLGIIEIPKINLQKIIKENSFYKDYKHKKLIWLSSVGGTHISTKKEMIGNKIQFTTHFKIQSKKYVEKVQYHQCGNSYVQIKSMIPVKTKKIRVVKKILKSIKCEGA